MPTKEGDFEIIGDITEEREITDLGGGDILPQTNKALLASEINSAISTATGGAHPKLINELQIYNSRCVTLARLEGAVSDAQIWTDYSVEVNPLEYMTSSRLVTGLNTDLFVNSKGFVLHVRLRNESGAKIALNGGFPQIILTENSVDGQYYTATFSANTNVTIVITKTGYQTVTRTVLMNSEQYVSIDGLSPAGWTYSLTTVQSGCTVTIGGTVKTSSSTTGQVFTGTTTSSSLSYSVTRTKCTSASSSLTITNPATSITLYHQVYQISTINRHNYAIGHTGNTSGSYYISTQITTSGSTGSSVNSAMRYLPKDDGKGEFSIKTGYWNLNFYGQTQIKITVPRRSTTSQTAAPRPNTTLPVATLYEYNRNTYESALNAEKEGKLYPIASVGGWTLNTSDMHMPATATLSISGYTPRFDSQATGFCVIFT